LSRSNLGDTQSRLAISGALQ